MTSPLVKRLAAFLLAAASVFPVFAQSDKPVKIGILNDQSGPYSSISGRGSVTAARLAVEDAGGSLFGKPIEIVVGNHQGKPDIGATLARQWYDQDGVSAIFDIYHSGVALAVQRLTQEKDKLLFVSMASSRDIGGKECSANAFQWANDGFALANIIIKGASDAKPNTWYFITVDYAAGHSIEKDSRQMVDAAGGKVLGSARFPLGSPDFSSFLLQAQASKAKNIGFIGGGGDFTNAAKQAREFGIQSQGQNFIPFSMTTEDIYALGNKVTANMPLVLSFYWDENPATRAWTERFRKASGGKMPTDPQANVYSAVLHYLKAAKAAGSTNSKEVLAKMKSMPVNDFFTADARVREDGRLMRPLYYAVAKAPEQMKGADDLLVLKRKFSGEESFIPAAASECPALAKK